MMKPKKRDFAKSVRSKLYDGNGDNRFGFKFNRLRSISFEMCGSSKQPVEPIKRDFMEP